VYFQRFLAFCLPIAILKASQTLSHKRRTLHSYIYLGNSNASLSFGFLNAPFHFSHPFPYNQNIIHLTVFNKNYQQLSAFWQFFHHNIKLLPAPSGVLFPYIHHLFGLLFLPMHLSRFLRPFHTDIEQ